MKWEEVATIAAKIEQRTGLPSGMLRAIATAESGAAQHSTRSFSFDSFDPMSRRVEPEFYERYIRGTYWETDKWGTVPEIVAASYGLCQVMFTTAVWALNKGLLRPRPSAAGGVPVDPAALPDVWNGQPWTLFDPAVNLRIAAEVFAYKARKYGSLAAGASAYNAGSPRTMASGIYENQSYVEGIRDALGGVWPDWRA